jgi:DNA-directed RNA polymerase specialized sigma24 family protein
MLINYKDADGNSIELEVSDDVGVFYLSSVEAEKKNTRRATRSDRHTSLETFIYEDKRFFDAGIDLLADLMESETINHAMSHLTERQQYLIRKICLEGWKYTELAGSEGVDESAIRHAVNRAKKRLKTVLS